MSIIEIKNLVFSPSGEVVLTVPSLSIENGQIVGIVGANGAGKSTLMKCIALLQEQTSGEILYAGKAEHSTSVDLETRRKTSIVLQQACLFNTTVFENVASGLKMRSVPRTERKEQVNIWLNKLNIAHLAKRHPDMLSGGEAQRVSLARALVTDPKILFLDEPFTGLDYPTKIQLLKELKEIITEKKLTCFFVSHDLQEVNFLSERLLVIEKGRIVQDGPTKEVIANPNEEASFIVRFKEFAL
jgi:tungstate transport system ATP-binding protein